VGSVFLRVRILQLTIAVEGSLVIAVNQIAIFLNGFTK